MSKTSALKQRRPADDYPTQRSDFAPLLSQLDLGGSSSIIVEPCAGRGRLVQVMQEVGYSPWAIELSRHRHEQLTTEVLPPPADLLGDEIVRHTPRALCADFLQPNLWAPNIPEIIDAFVTNPPFALLVHVLRTCLTHVRPGGLVALLATNSFLETPGRYPYMCLGSGLRDVFTLAFRPRFVGSVKCGRHKGGCGLEMWLPVETTGFAHPPQGWYLPPDGPDDEALHFDQDEAAARTAAGAWRTDSLVYVPDCKKAGKRMSISKTDARAFSWFVWQRGYRGPPRHHALWNPRPGALAAPPAPFDPLFPELTPAP